MFSISYQWLTDLCGNVDAKSSHMQSDMDKLISRIIWAGAEDGHSELLAELIRVAPLQQAFLSRFFPEINVTDTLVVRTQVRNRVAGGVPDLALDGDTLVVRIECKLWATLTDYQPVEYVKELASISQQTEAMVRLLFLAPEARREEINAELEQRLQAARRASPNIEHGVGVTTITWQEVADAICTVDTGDPLISFLQRSFRFLVDRFAKTVILSPADVEEIMNLNTIKAVCALGEVLNSLRGSLQNRGENVTPITGPNFHWQGFYSSLMENSEHNKLWIGLFYRASVFYEKGPVWVQLNGTAIEHADRRTLTEAGFQALDASRLPSWGGTIIPLKLMSTDNNEEQVRQLIDQIDRIRLEAAKAAKQQRPVNQISPRP